MASSLLLEPPAWPPCSEAHPIRGFNASLQTQPSGDKQPGSQRTAAPPHSRPAPRPPPALSQLPARRPAVQGCQHCITCASLTTHAHTAGRAGSAGHMVHARPPPACKEWWPSGLPSPTIYLHLRRRQLHLQYLQAATPEGAAKLWRPLGEWKPCALLAARGQLPLGLLIPLQCTNVQQTDGPAQLMAVKSAPRRTARQAAAAQPAGSIAAQALRRSRLREEALAAAELLLCCGEELPLLPPRGRRLAGGDGGAAMQPVSVAASMAAAKREALTRSSTEQEPKRTRLEAAPVRRAAALHLAAQPAQACQQQQLGRQQQGEVQAQGEGEQAGPWWLRHPATQQAAATRTPALPGRCLPSTSPGPPSSLLATPGDACLAAGCATGQATPLLLAAASSGLLTAPSSGRGSLLLSTPELLPLARRASATGVFSVTAHSGASADLAARLPSSPFDSAAASAAASCQRQQHLLEVKAQHAFPCSEVVLQVGEEAPLAGPSILSALFRLASRLAG